MSQFMFLFRGGGYASADPPSPTELQAHLGRWTAWTDGLMKSGKLVAAQALTHPPTGRTVRGRDRVVTDGPYAESKDLVSGTLVVEAATIEEAVAIARECPIFEHDGSVEVRPVLVPPAP